VFKSLKRLLKNRNFLFCVITYPLAYCLFLYAKQYLNMHPLPADKVNWVSGVSFAVLAFVTGFTIYELIEKRLFHKVQGDKLKMKQHQRDWRG